MAIHDVDKSRVCDVTAAYEAHDCSDYTSESPINAWISDRLVLQTRFDRLTRKRAGPAGQVQ
eukprot:8224520-Pyramimonas_sp.AAC.1